jgi:hypothetical protein
VQQVTPRYVTEHSRASQLTVTLRPRERRRSDTLKTQPLQLSMITRRRDACIAGYVHAAVTRARSSLTTMMKRRREASAAGYPRRATHGGVVHAHVWARVHAQARV